MGLIHWWPLVGDDVSDKIRDSSFNLTKYNTKTATNILGSGFAFGTSTNSRLNIPISAVHDLRGSFSVSFWLKINTWNTSYATFLGLYKDTISWNGNIVSFLRNSSSSTIAFCISDGSSYTNGSCVSGALSTGTWYRVTGVYSPGSIKIYINSTLHNTISTTVIPNTKSVNFANIGAANDASYQTDSSIQDVRFYDHALSLKEISELSKAMVVHYSFDDIQAEPTTNLLPEDKQSASVNAAAGVYGDPATINITSGLTNGADYTLSLLQTVGSANQSTGVSSRLICYYTDGTYDDNSTSKMGITLPADDKEYYYEINVTTNKNKTIDHLGGWILDHSVGTGKVRSYRNAQIEAKSFATPYTKTSRSSKICNEAGLVNPSSVSSVSLIKDSAVGKMSLNCKGSTYIRSTITGDTSIGATASVWIKTPTYPSANAIVFADHNSKLAFGFYGTENAIISCGSYYSGVVSNIKSSWKSGWNHICITRATGTSGAISCWLNGSKLTLSSTTNYWTTSDCCVVGGRYNSGNTTGCTAYVDDFRLYHTILSDNDIKRIYNSRFSLTPSYTMVADSPMVERKASFNPTTNGFEMVNLVEPATMKLSDGSEWLCIFNHDLRDDETWFTNATEASICSNKENRYSLLNYISQFKSTDNKYEFILSYPERGRIEDGFYNRWTQTSDPNTAGQSVVSGFTAVTTKWSSYNKGLAKSASTSTYMNTNVGGSTWYGAIGQYGMWTTGKYIPAADSNSAKATQLWIRTDNTSYKGYFKTYDSGAMLASRIDMKFRRRFNGIITLVGS